MQKVQEYKNIKKFFQNKSFRNYHFDNKIFESRIFAYSIACMYNQILSFNPEIDETFDNGNTTNSVVVKMIINFFHFSKYLSNKLLINYKVIDSKIIY